MDTQIRPTNLAVCQHVFQGKETMGWLERMAPCQCVCCEQASNEPWEGICMCLYTVEEEHHEQPHQLGPAQQDCVSSQFPGPGTLVLTVSGRASQLILGHWWHRNLSLTCGCSAMLCPAEGNGGVGSRW